ncbi:MAG: hypothetical protein UW55_C0010G0025 [Candidatus Giovannonibacteria bacterium GW2011_GWA2_44_26]|uniref:Uncharacterized protein n=1 Tax=Candidatus Giovannonibacteria bacterium GW2011_GWA2_44_26 TaxID=1618648 RepID=A0A0G1ITK0_9BACT|nr:MAG: hypothetical protein UW55_C0010G0025 [Candidatus Giovannonibacteria bacterium GW2011_GWA2_44_26]
MSAGEGILWATILVLFAVGVRHISKTRKWKHVGIGAGVLVAGVALISAGIYFYYRYQNRPVAQSGLFGVELGRLPVDVKLALGEPKSEESFVDAEGNDTLFYTYQEYSWDGVDKFVRFKKQGDEWKTYLICDLDPDGELYGLYTFTDETEVLKKFGQPSHESISADGLKKMSTFDSLNIAVEFEKKEVSTVCVTDSDGISFVEEFE